MIRPIRPAYITREVWGTLSRKEKDFVQLLKEKTLKKDIMRQLYITSEVGYWKLRKRVLNKINQVNGKAGQ